MSSPSWMSGRVIPTEHHTNETVAVHPYAPPVTHTTRTIIFHSQSAALSGKTLGGPGLSTNALCTSTVTNPPRGVYPLGATSASWITIGMRKAKQTAVRGGVHGIG